jgi:peptidoglycan/LPS O-acetylase OafA/YrhL
MQPGQSTPSDQTGRYLIDETFMRSLLELPNIPAVVWIELMAAQPYVTNEMTDSLLTEYYDVPQVSIKTAWHNRLPFDASEIWAENPLKMTALGHKLVAVTLVNFMCFEFKHTCHSSGVPSKALPKPLFSPQLEGEKERISASGADGFMARGYNMQELAFCSNKGLQSLPPEGGRVESSPHTTWSAFAMIALIPILLLSICAFFVKAGSQFYLENNLPMQLPELEFLRIIATVNIVAFQFYQNYPPKWSYGGDDDENEHGSPCIWCRSGGYCFQFFFLYSGFVLTLSAIRSGTSSAIWQYAQVWPLHAFGLILSLISGAEINPLSLELCACLVHSWGPPFHSNLNGPSWYLSTLIAFWIMLPLWVRAADRVCAVRGIFGISIFLVCVWLSTLLFPIFVYFHPLKLGLHEEDPKLALQNIQAFRNFIQYSPYCNWAPMVMGILLACLVMLGIEPRTSLSAGICLAVALVGLSLAWFLVPSPGFSMGTEQLFLEKGFGLLPMFSMLILGSVGARNFSNPFHRLVTGRWMVLPAKLCWPVFILHEPVHKLCARYLFPYLYSNPNAYWLNSCLYPLALFLASLGASYLIDQPWAKLLFRCRKGNGAAPDGAPPQGSERPYNKDASYERVQGYRNNRSHSMR